MWLELLKQGIRDVMFIAVFVLEAITEVGVSIIFFMCVCGLVSSLFKGICGCITKRWPSHRHHDPDGGLLLTIRSCWFKSMLELWGI